MELSEIVPYLAWPLFTLVIALFVIFIFKDQIKNLIPNIKVFGIGKSGFEMKFGQELKQAKKKVKGIKETVAASGSPARVHQVIDFRKQTARDIVLETWGALKQTVYSACTANRIQLTPATGIPAALQRLGDKIAIDSDIDFLIRVLHGLGQELANDTDLRPVEDDARAYKELSDLIMDWMMLNILPADQTEKEGNGEESLRDRTVVGVNFPKPRPGHPAAVLSGIGGKVLGRQFPVDKEHYRIGWESDNDLCIKDDDYVSAKHAALRYEAGSLYLSDLGSTSGTFLNDKQIKDPVMVRQKDNIRLGQSVFQVSEAANAPRKPIQDKNGTEHPTHSSRTRIG